MIEPVNTLMKIDAKTQNMDIDLNGMFKYMVENFIVKTEPSLSAIDILRLNSLCWRPNKGNFTKSFVR